MSKGKHTKLPWKIGVTSDNRTVVSSGMGKAFIGIVADVEVDHWKESRRGDKDVDAVREEINANGAFIVKAVNSHDQLVKALKLAQSQLEYCGYGDAWERECAEEADVEGKIDEALKAAGEEMK